MELLRSQQIWEMSRAHQADLLKEAQQSHLAKQATGNHTGWWQSLFSGQDSRVENESLPMSLEPSAAE
jgi:hypothetical protein